MEWLFLFLLISVVLCLSVVRSHYEPYGENVAFNKPANQSTTYSEGTFMYSASLGVDGGISTNFSSKTCSHTNEYQTKAWWTVNLLGFYLIKFIRIYQRTYNDIDNNRLNSSELYGRLKDHTWQRIYFNSTMPPVVFNVTVILDKPVCEIMLNISNALDAFICVCELEAFKVIECSPYSIENGSIKVEQYGDSNQTFTYGTKLSVTCHEGYRISDDGRVANETESNLQCNATGNWSRNLRCTVTVCGWPPNLPNNSKQTITPGIAGNTTYNATLTVECNEGYNYSVHEKELLRCGNDGIWAGNLGICNVIDCGQPLNIPGNSTLMFSAGLAGNTSYNATLTVQCNKGFNYTLPGNETIRCGREGRWPDILGLCKVIDCGLPLNIPGNSTINASTGLAGNTSYNATFTILCNKGFNYTLPGSDTVRCGIKGHWTGNLGLCEVIDCGRPLTIPGNSTLMLSAGLAGNTSYNATLTVQCNKGFNYTLPGNETICCGREGRWPDILGLCKVIDCGQPLNIPGNSTVMFSTGSAGNTSYDATLTVLCNNGFNFTLPGHETIRCGNEGRWPDILGRCKAIECFIIFSIDNGEIKIKATGVDGKNNTYGVKLSVECDSGFTSNVLEITCLESGLSSQPVCSADHKPTDLIAAIVGSVVTFITVVAIVVGIVIFMRRRRKHKDDATRTFDQNDKSKVGGSRNHAAMDFHKDFDMEDIKSKSIGLDNIAIEPYDTLQMDNRSKSEYDELKFERESSLEATMKDEPYQNMRLGN